MKKLKGFLIFVLAFISVILLNNTKSFAAEAQYTNNIVPKMTSSSSSEGTVSVSSCGDDRVIWNPFDGATDYNGSWYTAKNQVTNQWIQYEFVNAKVVTKYTITQNAQNYIVSPKDWRFEAWDENNSAWVILDKQVNITSWSAGTKEFAFNNTTPYHKYRLFIVANTGNPGWISIAELEMMETVSSPSNLTAKAGSSSVELSWNPVINAQNYIVKRSTTPGGPYDKITPYTPATTNSPITFLDNDVTLNTTYYYVISAVVSGTESVNSNEASATSIAVTNPDYIGNYATLVITMKNGGTKEYSLPISDIDEFFKWYDLKSDGAGKSYYTFTKSSSIAPYLRVKEYIAFDKISSFEIKEFNQ